jgi:peroxiredoxin
VKRDPLVLIVVAMVISLMLVYGIRTARHAPSWSAGGNGNGTPAPDFTLQTLDGKPLRLSDFRGKAVLLNFWATWCEPCKVEMPWFVEMQKQYAAEGLQVIGVSMDDDGPEEVAKFAKEMAVDYPILLGKQADRDSVANLYGGVQFLPETFYIDRQGKIVDKSFGLKGRGEIEDSIKKALGQSRAAKQQPPQASRPPKAS